MTQVHIRWIQQPDSHSLWITANTDAVYVLAIKNNLKLILRAFLASASRRDCPRCVRKTPRKEWRRDEQTGSYWSAQGGATGRANFRAASKRSN